MKTPPTHVGINVPAGHMVHIEPPEGGEPMGVLGTRGMNGPEMPGIDAAAPEGMIRDPKVEGAKQAMDMALKPAEPKKKAMPSKVQDKSKKA